MSAAAVFALVIYAVFSIGVVIGRRVSDASHYQGRLVEAFDRDQDVLDVADMATDSSE